MSIKKLGLFVLLALLVIGAVSSGHRRHGPERFQINPSPTYKLEMLVRTRNHEQVQAEVGYAPADYNYSCLQRAWPAGYVGPIRYALPRVDISQAALRLSDDMVLGARCRWMLSEVILHISKGDSRRIYSVPRKDLESGRRIELDCWADRIPQDFFCLSDREASRIGPPYRFRSSLTINVNASE